MVIKPKIAIIVAISLLLFISIQSFMYLQKIRPTNSLSPIVGAIFYPWYSVSRRRHWDNTIDRPYIGYYDSYNNTVIEWQLKLIKNAGIDFIVFSWWGPNSFEDNVTKTLAKYLRKYGIQFTIMLEPYLGNEHPEYYNKSFWANNLEYISKNHVEPYSDIYLFLEGKPLVMAFNPIGMEYNPSSDFPDYTIRITGNDIDSARYQDWDYWPDYIDPEHVTLKIRRNGYVVIIPRYDDTHFRDPGRVDQNYTENLYVKEWEWILEHKDAISIVMITSWNEYHERTMIEPHYDGTVSIDPFYIYNPTKTYIEKLKGIEMASRRSISTVIRLYYAQFCPHQSYG